MNCPACGKKIKPPLVSISHTIAPGKTLCPDCGNRETLDPAWAFNMRTGFLQAIAAREGLEKAKEYKARKGPNQ